MVEHLAKIVVLGSINMDLVAATHRIPGPGETVIGTEFRTTHGGKGANQAVAACRLGAKVTMVGRVGSDPFGTELVDNLAGTGVDIEHVHTDPSTPSGVAIILLDEHQQNFIIGVYGANMQLDDRELDAVRTELSDADVLMIQMETPVELSLKAAAIAKDFGVRVVMDPAPPSRLSQSSYRLAGIVTPNQSEAEVLTGVVVTEPTSAKTAARALVDLGAKVAIVKIGELGVVYATNDRVEHIPAYTVDSIDTVGAGDVFAGGVAVALAEGETVGDAVRFGAAAGAIAVTKIGAQDSMPYRAEVDDLVFGTR